MSNEILHQLNWVDVLAGLILARTIYIGVQKGIVIETFKLISVFFAVIIALHYYAVLTETLHLPPDFGYLLIYAVLCLTVGLIFRLIREGLLVLIKMEATSQFDKIGGFIVAIARGFLICSLVILFIRVPETKYIKEKVQQSFFGSYFDRLAPQVYESCYNGFIVKFFPSEKLNKKILALGHGQDTRKKKSN